MFGKGGRIEGDRADGDRIEWGEERQKEGDRKEE